LSTDCAPSGPPATTAFDVDRARAAVFDRAPIAAGEIHRTFDALDATNDAA
jgi:hypothetical protein